MSVLDSVSSPNVYKLEKFVVVNTQDTYSNKQSFQGTSDNTNKVAVLRPNMLQCYKVIINITANDDGTTTKTEIVDAEIIYDVVVPLGLQQVDNANANANNSTICPPYIASNENNIRDNSTQTLTELITNNFIHPQSIIYGQKRDFKANIVGDAATYIDINAEGRTLKVSSLTDKSNGVSLSDYTQNQSSSDYIDNRFTAGSAAGITKLFKACMINEDSAIEFISDIDQVNVGSITGDTAAGEAAGDAANIARIGAKRYHIQVDSGSKTDVKVSLVQDTGGSATGKDNFHQLNDVKTEDFEVKTRGHLPQVDPSKATGGKLTGNYLNNFNLAGTENTTTSDTSKGSTPMFAVCALDQSGSEVSSVVLKALNDMMGRADGVDRSDGAGGSGKDSILRVVAGEAEDSFSSQTAAPQNLGNSGGLFNENTVFVLTASKSEVRFRQLGYLDQLGGVVIDDDVKNDDDIANGVITVAKITKHTNSPARHQVTFEKMSSIFKSPGTTITKDDTSELSSFFLVNANGTAEPPFETAKLDPDLFSGGVTGGEGTVRYVPSSNTVQLKDSNGFGGGESPKDFLNYQPKLFGICREDGSYEYRYFLTSAAVTTTT